MIKFSGFYYDGQRSEQTPVEIIIDESGEVTIIGNKVEISTHLEQIKIAARLADTRRNIFLANGAKLETNDNAAVDQVCRYFEQNKLHQLLHKLEQRWPAVVIAFLVTLLFTWGTIEYGVPVAAKWVAKGVPLSVEQKMGQQGLETLDNWLFARSELAQQQQADLQQSFKQLVNVSDQHYHYRLLFRSSIQMGANALALPGGIIIVTDGLVVLAENEQQLMAVIAHEIGHIKHQHGLRSILQDSLAALFMAGLLGDITSISSLSVALPTILVESHFSRQFELQADRFSVKIMQQLNIPVEQFVTILNKLDQQHTKVTDYEFDYLSSHPAIDQRIKTIRTLLPSRKIKP